jgi:hypothetical protein
MYRKFKGLGLWCLKSELLFDYIASSNLYFSLVLESHTFNTVLFLSTNEHKSNCYISLIQESCCLKHMYNNLSMKFSGIIFLYVFLLLEHFEIYSRVKSLSVLRYFPISFIKNQVFSKNYHEII